jgi:hypothetical protein
MPETDQKLEILQLEYARHCETLNTHIQSTLNDWKTASVGALLIGWIPAAKYFTGDGKDSGALPSDTISIEDVLALGFTAAVSLAGILALRVLFRLSFIYFLADLVKTYECRINDVLGSEVLVTYNMWADWRQSFHKYVLVIFAACWALFIIAFPPISYSVLKIDAVWAYQIHFGVCAGFLVLLLSVFFFILKPRFVARSAVTKSG